MFSTIQNWLMNLTQSCSRSNETKKCQQTEAKTVWTIHITEVAILKGTRRSLLIIRNDRKENEPRKHKSSSTVISVPAGDRHNGSLWVTLHDF